MTGYPNVCKSCGFGYGAVPRCDCAAQTERERVMQPGELSRWTLDRLEREREAEPRQGKRLEAEADMQSLYVPFDWFIHHQLTGGRTHHEPVLRQFASVGLRLPVDRAQADWLRRWFEGGASVRVTIEAVEDKRR
jgi:hypothetical protein